MKDSKRYKLVDRKKKLSFWTQELAVMAKARNRLKREYNRKRTNHAHELYVEAHKCFR
jgi:hypothetical protein